MKRTYEELIKYKTFEDRFKYLKLNGEVGSATFGFDRYLNQAVYKSYEWQKIRKKVILRDYGCNLAIPDMMIPRKVIVHHMNPINEDDILNRTEYLLNPEFLICTDHITHNAIHYGDEGRITFSPYHLANQLAERKPNDTIPWRM